MDGGKPSAEQVAISRRFLPAALRGLAAAKDARDATADMERLTFTGDAMPMFAPRVEEVYGECE